MQRVLYHGSEFIIKEPEYLKGNVHNDYGLGFYCTTNKELAKEWAAKRTGKGYINKYSLRDDRLKILDLTKPPFNDVLYWVSLLMHNRELSSNLRSNYPREIKYLEEKYLLNVSEYDVVIGYRADDSYFSFAQDFLNGTISYSQLNEAMRLGKLGQQYVIKSQRAFERLTFTGVESAPRDQWFAKKRMRDSEARETYRRMFKGYKPGELYITRILDEGLTTDDLRL